jgi:hypothetical protein
MKPSIKSVPAYPIVIKVISNCLSIASPNSINDNEKVYHVILNLFTTNDHQKVYQH